MSFFLRWASFLFKALGWASFLFKALGWASFRDGLPFFLRASEGFFSRWASIFLRPSDELLFEMGFFLFKALGWASF